MFHVRKTFTRVERRHRHHRAPQRLEHRAAARAEEGCGRTSAATVTSPFRDKQYLVDRFSFPKLRLDQ